MSPDRSETAQLQQRNHELAILKTIAEALNRTLAIDQALGAGLAHAAGFFGLETGWVWLLNPETEASYLAAAQNLPPGLLAEPQRMEGGCHCLSTYRSGDLRGAANVNVVQCSRLSDLVEGSNGLSFHASVPINAHGRKLGLLNLAGRDWRELSAEDIRLLSTIGDMLGIAVERARLFEQSADLGAERERNRLAREIHDTLAQGLAGIALQLESAEAMAEAGAPTERLRPVLARTLALARGSLEEARRSVLDLRAAPLEGRTLAVAIADLAAGAAPQVACEIIGGDSPLPARLEAGLYRIAQEALTNVRRHAHARRVVVRLTVHPARVELLIEDDGIGFDTAQPPAGRFGLIGLSERAHLLGGTLVIESSPGAGTRLQVQVPR